MATEVAVRPSAVKRALEMAQPVTAGEDEIGELAALRKTQRILLPIEKKSARRVEQRVVELERQILQAEIGLPVLSLDVFGWRHKNGLPKIVPVSLNQETFTVYATGLGGGRKHTGVNPGPGYLPEAVIRMFADVEKVAASYINREGACREYTFEFDGMIPNHARVSIAQAMRDARFDSLFLAVEAPEHTWKVTHKRGLSRKEQVKRGLHRFGDAVASINLDPLVVGWSSRAYACFVLDSFDLTTLEQYVLDEFSHKALLPGS